MPDRVLWSAALLASAAAWLIRECNGNPIRMSDLNRAALHLVRRRKGRALRDALLAAGRLEHRTPRGRMADYRVVALDDPDDGGREVDTVANLYLGSLDVDNPQGA